MTNIEEIKQKCKEQYSKYGMTSKVYESFRVRDRIRCSGVIMIETFSMDDKIRHEFIHDCRHGNVLFGWQDLKLMREKVGMYVSSK